MIFEFSLSFRRLANYRITILADDITVHCSNIFSNLTNVTVKKNSTMTDNANRQATTDKSAHLFLISLRCMPA